MRAGAWNVAQSSTLTSPSLRSTLTSPPNRSSAYDPTMVLSRTYTLAVSTRSLYTSHRDAYFSRAKLTELGCKNTRPRSLE